MALLYGIGMDETVDITGIGEEFSDRLDGGLLANNTTIHRMSQG